jgi:hypothetical protein
MASGVYLSPYILMGGGEVERQEDHLWQRLVSSDRYGMIPTTATWESSRCIHGGGCGWPHHRPFPGSPEGPGATVSVVGSGSHSTGQNEHPPS